MVGGHGAGDAGGKHVGGADGEAESVGGADGGHGGDFGYCSLRVSEMALADFFSNGYDDALPSNHGAESESHGDGNLDPEGNEAGGVIDVLFVVGEDGGVRGGDLRSVTFLHETQGFADEIHIIAEVTDAIV